MTKGRTSRTDSPTRPLGPREEAMRKSKEQIETGHHIRDQRMSSMADLDSTQERRANWMEGNVKMYEEGGEIPSDYPGAVAIPIDSRGGWRLLVAKEIKQAGKEIDLNKAM